MQEDKDILETIAAKTIKAMRWAGPVSSGRAEAPAEHPLSFSVLPLLLSWPQMAG